MFSGGPTLPGFAGTVTESTPDANPTVDLHLRNFVRCLQRDRARIGLDLFGCVSRKRHNWSVDLVVASVLTPDATFTDTGAARGTAQCSLAFGPDGDRNVCES